MAEFAENHIRWEPLPALPEYPCEAVRVSYDGFCLVATAIYTAGSPLKGLVLDFGRMEACKIYEEFSDPWMDDTSPQPSLQNTDLNAWTYPLQEVTNSRWIERLFRRNGGIDHLPLRHYLIVTADVTLHVAAADNVKAVELPF